MQWLLRFNEMEETVYGIYALANAVELNRGFFFYFPCTYNNYYMYILLKQGLIHISCRNGIQQYPALDLLS